MISPVKMVDLRSQYLGIQSEIDEALAQVLEGTDFVHGARVGEFEQHLADYLHVGHVIGVGSGTDALTIALMALGLDEGDEVITPTFTFVATAEAAAMLRLKPVLVDVEPDTFNLSVRAVEQAITPRTRAIIPVHLFGQPAAMDEIMALAAKHNLYVVEDACQAMGATYTGADGVERHAGTIGHIGCTSFFPSKNLGGYGDGGALFTNDDQLAARMRSIANHGMRVRYHYDRIGLNSRLDTMQAAVLDVKLRHLPEFLLRRREAADFYNQAFASNPRVQTPRVVPGVSHAWHQYSVLIDAGRDQVRSGLSEAGIPSMVYYPVPLHRQQAYVDLGSARAECPVADRLSATILSLPMHTCLTSAQLQHITSTLNRLTTQNQ